MKFESKIYQQSEKPTPWIAEQKFYWISIGLCLFLIIILIFNRDYWQINLLKSFIKPIIYILILSIGFFKIKGMLQKEPLNGTLQGNITITPEFIIIDQNKYNYSDVSDLNLTIQNYSGKLQGKPNYIGPWISKGTDNQIYFRIDNQIIKSNFVIENENDFNKLRQIKLKIENTVANNGYKK